MLIHIAKLVGYKDNSWMTGREVEKEFETDKAGTSKFTSFRKSDSDMTFLMSYPPSTTCFLPSSFVSRST